MNAYAHVDTRKADGFYVQFHMVTEPDDSNDRPDERDDGFWPSQDPTAAGYVGATDFEEQQTKATERMDAWRRGDWQYVGVQAEARCLVVRHRVGTFYTLRSPGVWGIESDAGDYLSTVFEEEKAVLLADMAAMQNPTVESA